MTDSLREAVERLHSCRATPNGVVRVVERHEGRVAWEGDVGVFDLSGHPSGRASMSTIEYEKACTCEGATATTGQIRLGQPVEDGGRFRFDVVRYPGPSCDECGTPWTRRTPSTNSENEDPSGLRGERGP